MNKQSIINSTKKLFKNKFKTDPLVISTAPGRINLIGEHLDYNNGVAIPCGINRWVCICASTRQDNQIIIYSDELDSEIILDVTLKKSSNKLWHKYVLGSLKVFKKEYKLDQGLNIFIKSNIPIGVGLSSSAALEVGLLSSYFRIFNIKIDKMKIAKMSQKIEHEYLLIKSGLLDQFSSLFSKEGHFIFINFRDQLYHYIKNNIKNYTFVAINSMIKRDLANSRYIERVNECNEGYKLLGTNKIEELSYRDLEKIEKYPSIQKRFKHIISEYERTHLMQKYIVNNDLIKVGNLLKVSHSSLKDDYEVSCNQIDFLINKSSDFSGWYGGRIMGGGFGGCTINLVSDKVVDQYIELLRKYYKKEFNLEPDCYNLKIVEGSMIES